MSPAITSNTYTGQWKCKYRVACYSHGIPKRKSWIKLLKLLSQCDTHRFVTQSLLKWKTLKEKTHTPAFALWPLRDSAPSNLLSSLSNTAFEWTQSIWGLATTAVYSRQPSRSRSLFVKICYQGPYTRCRVLDVTKRTCLSSSVNRPETAIHV